MAKSKVRGMQKAQHRISKLIGEVEGKKRVRAIYSALLIIGAESATMVPMDTSTLINSQYRSLHFKDHRLIGKVGYSANYAAYVHDASGKLKGKPRDSVSAFGTSDGRTAFASNQGNFWDPRGQPRFLTKAVKTTKKQVDEVIKREMSL